MTNTHNKIPRTGRWRVAIISTIVVLSGLLLAVSPLGHWLEEEISLPWLFKWRGEIPAPQDVVVVSIDQETSRRLNLPNVPRKWPRDLHGRLVDKLHQHGASAVAFDIIFEETRNTDHNQRFAQALSRANNVVLFQYLKQEMIDIGPQGTAVIEKLISPIPVLADNATGLSPFPLPKVPAKVNHFLLYKPELGDAPTMPVTMLQLHALPAYDAMLTLILQVLPQAEDQLPARGELILQRRGVQTLASKLRQLFIAHPELATQLRELLSHSALPPQQHRLIDALIFTYSAPHSMHLNFYGAPRTISTIPYYRVLESDPDSATIDVNGKAVFVGFSEAFQPEQKDGFYTVYTQDRSGLDISGVEIMATAFANLLEQSALHVPAANQDMALLIVWGIAVSLLLRLTPGSLQFPLAMLLAVMYLAIVYLAFSRFYVWLPLATPLMWQLPLATVLSFSWKYLDVHRERRNIREAFGYHLPATVVDKIADDIDHVTRPGEKVQGIVMATDAAQYTRLSEQLSPEQLHELMNDYYAAIFKPISDHDGIVSDVVGDAAMAIWANIAEPHRHHQQACESALHIQRAVEEFNRDHPAHRLETRIGLHSGEIVMGHVGALNHYEYRAIGDIVNTASRIEGLNKQLGTRILVSQTVQSSVTGLAMRRLGRFQLAGKQEILGVYELVGLHQTQANDDTFYNDFNSALAAFEQGDIPTAQSMFNDLAKTGDGPSRFYLQHCEALHRDHHYTESGVIVLADK